MRNASLPKFVVLAGGVALTLSPITAAAAETVLDLTGAAGTLYTSWPEPNAGGTSVLLPAGTSYSWDWREPRFVYPDGAVGGNVYSSGNLTVPSGEIGMKVRMYDAAPVTAVETRYFGGPSAGVNSTDTIQLTRLSFNPTYNDVGFATGAGNAHRLVLQANLNLGFQNHTSTIASLTVYNSTTNNDYREVDFNGHAVVITGGTLHGTTHGGYSSAPGVNLNGGSLTFQDFNTTVYAGMSANVFSGEFGTIPAPTGVGSAPATLYFRGAGTVNWNTLGQQELGLNRGSKPGYYDRFDASAITFNVGNNKTNAGVSEWEVWSDGTLAALGTLNVGGLFAADIKLADDMQNAMASGWLTGSEQLLTNILDVAGNGHLDLNGMDVTTSYLTVNGVAVNAGTYAASDFSAPMYGGRISDTGIGGSITVVPEPVSIGFMAAAVLLMASRRRRTVAKS